MHHAFKFAILTLSGENRTTNSIDFSFFCRTVSDSNNEKRRYKLSSLDILRVNPNTGTSPIFRTRQDAELIKNIYTSFPVIYNELSEINPWKISIHRMVNQSDDSDLLVACDNLKGRNYQEVGNHFTNGSSVF